MIELIDDSPYKVVALEDSDWKPGISSYDVNAPDEAVWTIYSDFKPLDLGVKQIREDLVKLFLSEESAAQLTFFRETNIADWETDTAITIDTAHLN